MTEYRPHKKTAEILNWAMDIIKSVPYKPSSRWLFYQLVQNYGLPKKAAGIFTLWTSRARKRFWNGWSPDTLSDSIRKPIIRGWPTKEIPAEPDRIKEQDYYVELWFEARAMTEQFLFHTEDYFVTMTPFGGELSIPMKSDAAKRLEYAAKRWKKPIIILYFGDCDKKGNSIPMNALKDIREWCSVPFEFIRCGLTLEQAREYNIPDNPDKPGEYQWEALDDEHAKNLIIGNLEKYWKKPKVKS